MQSDSTPNARRGAFIVIEGMDRAGKTTQAALLRDRLAAASPRRLVELIKFPGALRGMHPHDSRYFGLTADGDRTTAIGKMIDAYLKSATDLDDRAIHLLFSANRWECASRIEALLAEGTTLVCDRYAFSGIAFSAAKPSLSDSFDWCATPDDKLPAPDAVVFLDVSPATAAARGGYGIERYEREEVQRAVRRVFARISGSEEAPEDHSKIGKAKNWHVVDAGQTIERVAEAVWAVIDEELLSNGTDRTLRRLWDYGPLRAST